MARLPTIVFSAFTLLCLAVLIVPSFGLVGRQNLKVSKLVTKLDSFGFQTGGSFAIRTEVIGNSHVGHVLKAYVCTEREYAMLPGDTYGIDSECRRNEPSRRCSLSARLNHSLEHVSFQITEQGRYNFLLVHCLEDPSVTDSLHVLVNYTALNPGGQQLPYGDTPLPRLYTFIVGGWFFFIALLSYQTIRNFAYRNQLHTALYLVVALKICVVGIAAFYWITYSTTGTRVDLLGYIRRFCFAVSETGFFSVLLLITKGWKITRFTLPGGEMKTLILALTLLLFTLLFFSFYSDDYYFLCLMIMYFFMLPKIFTSITKNIRKIGTQLWIGSNLNVPGLPTGALQRKLNMFKTLRISIAIYLASILLINSMRIIMIWYLDWVNIIVNEVVGFGIVAVVLWLLRPREHGVFTDMSEIAALGSLQAWLERTTNAVQQNAPLIEAWDIATTLIIEWPSSRSTLSPTLPDGSIDEEELSKRSLSMAVEEEYDHSQKFELSKYHH